MLNAEKAKEIISLSLGVLVPYLSVTVVYFYIQKKIDLFCRLSVMRSSYYPGLSTVTLVV